MAHHLTIKHNTASVEYHAEAESILRDSSDPTIRYAVISLGVLHDGLEARRRSLDLHNCGALARIHNGLDAYNTAISSLAARLKGEPSRALIHSVLLCCQVFISIDLVLGDYASGIQHFLYGLRIMHQYRSRPAVRDDGQVLMPSSVNLPHLDLFIIKLFASGHRTERQTVGSRPHMNDAAHATETPMQEQARNELAVISIRTSEFLGNLSKLRNPDQVSGLQTWRIQILKLLQCWDGMYSKGLQQQVNGHTHLPVKSNAIFSLLLYHVIKVVVNLAMSSSMADINMLESDFKDLHRIASFATQSKVLRAK